jgi:hypothetical protein
MVRHLTRQMEAPIASPMVIHLACPMAGLKAGSMVRHLTSPMETPMARSMVIYLACPMEESMAG